MVVLGGTAIPRSAPLGVTPGRARAGAVFFPQEWRSTRVQTLPRVSGTASVRLHASIASDLPPVGQSSTPVEVSTELNYVVANTGFLIGSEL